jgi:HPr kinase/phosphorylase
VVELSVSGSGLIGRAPTLTREILEVRGLGLINVRELFGDRAFQPEAPVELCIEFCGPTETERLDTSLRELSLAGITVPKFDLPVRPGRNLAVLVETAVRLYTTRDSHGNTTRSVLEKHSAILAGLQ